MSPVLILAGALAVAEAPAELATRLPFAAGEALTMRITYATLLAGRASLNVRSVSRDGRDALQFEARARSDGLFSRLLDFDVRDRTRATWDPASGCSLGIEKRLREGRAVRDQVVAFDASRGVARVDDPKLDAETYDVGPCPLDVLSALFVTRLRGVPEGGSLRLPLFDNGKRYELEVRYLGRELLDLPEPFGAATPTVVVEPLLLEGTGLFVKEGRLKVWLTDDARRVPVKWASRVPVGSVVGSLESYESGER